MNLKAYLANIRMTIKDFAVHIGCNPVYLSRVLNEKLYPSARLSKDIYNETKGVVKIYTRKEKEKMMQQTQ